MSSRSRSLHRCYLHKPCTFVRSTQCWSACLRWPAWDKLWISHHELHHPQLFPERSSEHLKTNFVWVSHSFWFELFPPLSFIWDQSVLESKTAHCSFALSLSTSLGCTVHTLSVRVSTLSHHFLPIAPLGCCRLCTAPGSKTLQILDLMQPEADQFSGCNMRCRYRAWQHMTAFQNVKSGAEVHGGQAGPRFAEFMPDMVQRRRGVGVENSQVTGLLIANDSKASRLRQSDFDRLTSLEWDGMG